MSCFYVLQCDIWSPRDIWVAWANLVMVTIMAVLRMMTEMYVCGNMSSTNDEPLNKLEVLVTR
jgi:hypothetical protein